jgi:hypothetical protein
MRWKGADIRPDELKERRKERWKEEGKFLDGEWF